MDPSSSRFGRISSHKYYSSSVDTPESGDEEVYASEDRVHVKHHQGPTPRPRTSHQSHSEEEGYLSEDEKSSRSFVSQKKVKRELWPQLDDDYYLGPHENFGKFGLSCVSHKLERFVVSSNHCCIQLNTSQPMKTSSKLTAFSDETKHLGDYIFPQRRDHTVGFDIIFPESGFYLFEIFAKPATLFSKQLVNVYNYMIKVQSSEKIINSFPKRFAHWRDGCYLYEPVILNSYCDLVHVKFKVHIHGAIKVAVVIDKMVWHHLEHSGDVFEGIMDMERYKQKNVKVVLEANYTPDNKYIPLLEYKI